jgi:hypothetical protein
MDWLTDVLGVVISAIPSLKGLVGQASVTISAIPKLFQGLPIWLLAVVAAGFLAFAWNFLEDKV